ncbi:MAG: class I SAM-dependent methyltransferase [Clostridiales bacterium]|nr:class I SAM-dependent methyltransferase [Clostridiales bacterium]
MSKRLDLIKSLIIPSRVIADVGCDHGLIAEYCTAKAERVIASDISEKCLQKAKVRLAGATNVTFICCDGLGYECDEAIISGMGGILIAQILRAAACLPQTLIVSPHRDGALVRTTLIELGYGIDSDIPIYDRGKFYSVIRAYKGGGVRELSHLQTVFGLDCATPNAELQRRLTQLYAVYSRAPQANKQQLSDVTAAMRLQNMQP